MTKDERDMGNALTSFCIWTFLQPGGQRENIPALKEAVAELIQMTQQKTAGQRGGKDMSWENLERVKMTVICEAVALVLSGRLDELEEKE